MSKKKKISRDSPYYNGSSYFDPTAGKTVEKMVEQDKKDAKKMKAAIKVCKEIFKGAGFEVAGRIPLRNLRTGTIYR